MNDLTDHVCVVAGGGTGIGLAVARSFAAAGGTTVAWDLTTPDESTADPGLSFDQVDVTDEAAVAAAVQRILGANGRIDVLYNNAGILLPGTTGASPETVDKVHLLSIDSLRRVLEVNVVGTFITCRAVLPSMIERHSGVIINTASAAAHTAFPAQAAYTASKGGVMSLTRQMAIDYSPDGVRICCISPGRIDTPMFQNLPLIAADTGSIREQLAQGLPIGRLGRAEDVANMATYLASPAASYITGAIFNVDGGFTAR